MEQAGSPILCSLCCTILDNTKEDRVKSYCNVCYAPYTCYTWKNHLNGNIQRNTVICWVCSLQRNACQVCLISNALPFRDGINSSNFMSTSYVINMGKTQNNKRKKPENCIYNLSGNCKKGVECLFRHDKLSEDQPKAKPLMPPADVSITTLYIGGVDNNIISEQDLQVQFSPYGEIHHINMVPAQKCAFVIYRTRQGAEKAAENLKSSVSIRDQRLKLSWANAQRPPKVKPEEKHNDEEKEATQLLEEQRAVEVEPEDNGNEVEEVRQKIRLARKTAMEEARERIKLEAGKMAYEYISQRDKKCRAQEDINTRSLPLEWTDRSS